MKIVYFANHNNPNPGDRTEEHIATALRELGHEVLCIHENIPEMVPASGYDMLLFHKGGHNLSRVLKKAGYPKVCWYFDKLWNDRHYWMLEVLPQVTMVAMSDEAWARRNPSGKIRIVHQGIGGDTTPGKPDPRYACKIAFTGSVYGERQRWVDTLKKRYGEAFQTFGSVFNRDLFDLCASVPIIVAPSYPSEDYYWSSRIYITIGSGGFVIHPKLKGLEKEYKDGVHYAGYRTTEELFQKIDYYLAHPEEREKIRMTGYLKTKKYFTYKKRVEKVIKEFSALMEAHR